MSPGRGKMSAEAAAGLPPVSDLENKAGRSQVSKEGDSLCGKCEGLVKDGDKPIECEICTVWFHILCEKIPEEVYKFMDEGDAGDQLRWCCSFCKRGCLRLHKRMSKMEKRHDGIEKRQESLEVIINEVKEEVVGEQQKGRELENRVGTLEAKAIEAKETVDRNTTDYKDMGGRLGSLEAKVANVEEKLSLWPSITDKPDSGTLPNKNSGTNKERKMETQGGDSHSFFREVGEMREKENNIVIYGVPESDSQRNDERIEHDKEFVENMIQACDVEKGNSILKVYRLGKTSNTRSRPRPLLVKQTDVSMKKAIFSNIRKLHDKDQYRNVRISHDLTRRGREHEAALWNEAKNRHLSGKGKHTVVGPPWRRRIVKAREHQGTVDHGTPGPTEIAAAAAAAAGSIQTQQAPSTQGRGQEEV